MGSGRLLARRTRTVNPFYEATSLVVDAEGGVWGSDRDGHRLLRVRPTGVPEEFASLEFGAAVEEILALALAPDGAVWIGTRAGMC